MEIKAGILPVLLAFISPKSEAISPFVSFYLPKNEKNHESNHRR